MSNVFEALQRLETQSNGIAAEFGSEAHAILMQPATTNPKEEPSDITEERIEERTEQRTEQHPTEARRAPARVAAVRVSLYSPLIPFMPAEKSHVKAGEQYRIIRTKLVQHPASPRFIAVSSVDPGDGKTVTSVNLAAALALKHDIRVLLIDGDLRRGKIAQLLGVPDTPGLGDVLSGSAQIDDALIQAEQLPGLHILTAGTRLRNPAELLDSPQWRAVARHLRERYDYVIMDTPPIGSVTDCDLIQAVSDGVVVVARPDYTNRSRCLNALNSIPPERLIGVVLNCVEEWFLGAERSYYAYKPEGPR